MENLSDLTIKEAQNRLRRGTLSVEDLCSKINERMEKTKGLNIHITTASEKDLLEQSKQSQRRIDEGRARPLEGIPIGFKDNFCSKEMLTTCASSSLLDFVPSYNSTLIQRCLDSGALITGKHNLDKFAVGRFNLTGYHGPVINPWTMEVDTTDNNNIDRYVTAEYPVSNGMTNKDFYVTGGSSGGSAAAVAAGTCLAAFGSDTGGSIRTPASYCGVVGLKPTYGLLSRHGLIPLVSSMDCPGIITKTVEDCAIVLNAVIGPDSADQSTRSCPITEIHLDSDLDLKGISVGIPKEYHVTGMSQEVLDLWRDMEDLLEKAGAKVATVSLPLTQESRECYRMISCCEVATTFTTPFDKHALGRIHDGEDPTKIVHNGECHLDLNEDLRGRLIKRKNYLNQSNYESCYLKAKQVRQEIASSYKSIFDNGVDLLLAPNTIAEAPLKSWCDVPENQAFMSTMDPLVKAANLTGLPAISIPLRLSKSGLPLSLQLIGQAFGESKLLSVAHWLEQTAKFPHLSFR